jgi:hypothetical protein
MKNKSLFLRLVGVALAFALIGAACGGSDNTAGDATAPATDTETTAPADEETTDSMAAEGVDTPVAGLEQTLTNLLDDHVYLAAVTLEQAVLNGLDSPQVKASSTTLDENSKALAGAIESVYGPEAGKQFLDLWRKHIGFFVDFTVAQIGDDKKAANKAVKNLDGYRADFGALIESATEGALPKDAVAEALIPHVDHLATAATMLVNGDPKVFDELYEAASHNLVLAEALATGIGSQQGLEGDAASGAAKLQATLTNLLDSHVYLASVTLEQAALNGLDSPQVKAASGTLDQNSQDLAGAIESVYGAEAGEQFLDLWRKHIGFFVDYAVGGISNDPAMQKKAVKNLDGYRSDFGALIESATEGGLPKDAVAKALIPHVQTLAKAVDLLVAGDGKVFGQIQEAASHNPGIATALAGAIVAQFPEKF